MEEVNPKCMTSSNRKKICEAQKFLLDGGFPTMHNFLPLKKNYKFRKVLLDGIGGSYLTSQCMCDLLLFKKIVSFNTFIRWRKLFHNAWLPPIEKNIANFEKFYLLDGGSYPTMHDFLPSKKILWISKSFIRWRKLPNNAQLPPIEKNH